MGTRWTYTASGPVTNVAARLTELASGGTVLVGAETFQRIAGLFVVEELGLRQLKNIKESVRVYHVLSEAVP
jgi:class 3 adenylate cyclase